MKRYRIIQKDDQVRWIPKSTDGVTQKAFEIIGWDDGVQANENPLTDEEFTSITIDTGVN